MEDFIFQQKKEKANEKNIIFMKEFLNKIGYG